MRCLLPKALLWRAQLFVDMVLVWLLRATLPVERFIGDVHDSVLVSRLCWRAAAQLA